MCVGDREFGKMSCRGYRGVKGIVTPIWATLKKIYIIGKK
jgi:hypothetical protein